MAYQVFARKYRPQTFADVVGQEHITRTLENAIRLGRIAQAYLFVGPRGTGKTSTARILAKALNCSNGPKVDFDNNEEICREISEGRCLDVLEIDGASNNGVDQVRDLRDNVRYTPVKGRYKIYIIDEVHMLSGAAFNALLKTLEEPPAHIKFIFATTEVHKLPATILSRCQRFDLRRISDQLIAKHLAHICEVEKVEAEPAALEAIARYAEGGMRDAESALDQTVSFYGNKLTEAEVLLMFGLTGLEPIANLSEAIADGDTIAVLKQSRELIRAGKDLGKLSQDLLRFFRNLIVHQLSPTALEAEATAAEIQAIGRVSAKISRAAAMEILDQLSQLESRLRYALAKDVVFEVALMQLSQLKEKVSLETVLQALAQAESSAPSAPAPAKKVEAPATPVSKPASSTATAAAPAAAKPIENPASIWEQTAKKFAESRPLEASTVLATRFLANRGNVFEVALSPALKNKLSFLTGPRNLAFLEETLKELCGRPIQIDFILIDPPAEEKGASAAPAAAEPPPPQMTDDDFKNDPLIQEAIERFQAKIVTLSKS